MSAKHDTPIDMPEIDEERATPSKRQIEQRQEWEALAVQLHADGYNSSVVARKLIQIHHMPDDAAKELVDRAFGRRVVAQTADSSHAGRVGAAMAFAGIAGAVFVFTFLGFGDRLSTILYVLLFAFAGKGISQAISRR